MIRLFSTLVQKMAKVQSSSTSVISHGLKAFGKACNICAKMSALRSEFRKNTLLDALVK